MRLIGAAGSVVIGCMAVIAPASPASAIIGGFPASSGTNSLVPQVVRVNADNGPRDLGENCSGTLIAAQWVVTAQHCTNIGKVQGRPYAPGKMTVKVNASAGNRAQTIGVAEVWRMPGYDSRTLVHDVAVLKLKKAVIDVLPARVATDPIPSGINAYVYGFGIVSEDSKQFRALPRVAEVRVRSRASLSSRCAIPDKYVLTTVVNGASATGDSGGPLVEWSDGRPTLFAVTGGDIDSATCQGGHAEKRTKTWVGLSTPVDRKSPGFAFLARHVPGLNR